MEVKVCQCSSGENSYSVVGAVLHPRGAYAAAKSLQSCPTLCNLIDGSPPGSPVPGILQARTLEWVAISFSKAWKWKVKVTLLSCVRLLATPWTAAHQAPLSMGFSRQEYWSGLPLPYWWRKNRSPISRERCSCIGPSDVCHCYLGEKCLAIYYTNHPMFLENQTW